MAAKKSVDQELVTPPRRKAPARRKPAPAASPPEDDEDGDYDLDPIEVRTQREHAETMRARARPKPRTTRFDPDDQIKWAQVCEAEPNAKVTFSRTEPTGDDNIPSVPVGSLRDWDGLRNHLIRTHWNGQRATYRWRVTKPGTPCVAQGYIRFEDKQAAIGEDMPPPQYPQYPQPPQPQQQQQPQYQQPPPPQQPPWMPPPMPFPPAMQMPMQMPMMPMPPHRGYDNDEEEHHGYRRPPPPAPPHIPQISPELIHQMSQGNSKAVIDTLVSHVERVTNQYAAAQEQAAEERRRQDAEYRERERRSQEQWQSYIQMMYQTMMHQQQQHAGFPFPPHTPPPPPAPEAPATPAPVVPPAPVDPLAGFRQSMQQIREMNRLKKEIMGMDEDGARHEAPEQIVPDSPSEEIPIVVKDLGMIRGVWSKTGEPVGTGTQILANLDKIAPLFLGAIDKVTSAMKARDEAQAAQQQQQQPPPPQQRQQQLPPAAHLEQERKVALMRAGNDEVERSVSLQERLLRLRQAHEAEAEKAAATTPAPAPTPEPVVERASEPVAERAPEPVVERAPEPVAVAEQVPVVRPATLNEMLKQRREVETTAEELKSDPVSPEVFEEANSTEATADTEPPPAHDLGEQVAQAG